MGVMNIPNGDERNLVPITLIKGEAYVKLTPIDHHCECCKDDCGKYANLQEYAYIPLGVARRLMKAKSKPPLESVRRDAYKHENARVGPLQWWEEGSGYTDEEKECIRKNMPSNYGTFGEGNKGRRNV